MEGLTAGFGMGPGVSPPLLPPETCMFQAVIFAFFPALIFVRLRSTYFHTPSLDSLDKLGKTRKSLRLCTCFLMRRPILSHLIDFGSDPKIQSHDFGLDLDAERMKHEGGGSEGVYVIRRGCADDCFAVMRQI